MQRRLTQARFNMLLALTTIAIFASAACAEFLT